MSPYYMEPWLSKNRGIGNFSLPVPTVLKSFLVAVKLDLCSIFCSVLSCNSFLILIDLSLIAANGFTF